MNINKYLWCVVIVLVVTLFMVMRAMGRLEEEYKYKTLDTYIKLSDYGISDELTSIYEYMGDGDTIMYGDGGKAYIELIPMLVIVDSTGTNTYGVPIILNK